MSDSDKSKKELIEELEALRAKLADSDTVDKPEESGDGISRRDVLSSAWVAPVILSVPVVGGIGVSQHAHAQPATGVPTAFPTQFPTQLPTTFPTAFPTSSIPTSSPATQSPTLIPTQAPTTLPTSRPTTQAPTPQAPSPFPTAAPGVIPVEVSDFEIS